MLLKITVVVAAIFTLNVVITQAYSSLSSSRSSRSDAYGDFYYDRRGYKVYTWCRDSYAYTSTDCRGRDSGRDSYYNSYDDRYRNDYNDGYGRDNSYSNDRNKVSVGQGTFRLINGGRDAELTCEFPLGSHLISNIVWTRVSGGRDNYYRERNSGLRDYFGRRMQVEQRSNHETTLVLEDYQRGDEGIYRCEASRSYNSYHGRGRYGDEKIYMEIDFRPRNGGYGNYQDDYYSRNRNYRYSGLKTEKDTVVKDEKLGKAPFLKTSIKQIV